MNQTTIDERMLHLQSLKLRQTELLQTSFFFLYALVFQESSSPSLLFSKFPYLFASSLSLT
jgi:hypothetical protein